MDDIPDKAESGANAGQDGWSDVQAAQWAAFQRAIRRKQGAWRVQRRWRLLALALGLPPRRARSDHCFDSLLQAVAIGDWEEAGVVLARLRQHGHPQAMEASLPFHDAQIRARQGETLQPLLARLELMRAEFAPADFLARSAAVHGATKDYDGFLDRMGAAWEATPQDPSRRVDYALAHARLGDLVRAQELLDGVDIEALPPQAHPLVWWARGLIELRNDRPAARATLRQGVEGLLNLATPADWIALALCAGACALAMRRQGDPAGARTLVGRVWPVLKVHADTRLRAEIDKEIGSP